MLLAFRADFTKFPRLLLKHKSGELLIVLLLLSASFIPASGTAAEKSLNIEDVTNDQGVKGLRATFQLHASRAAIWNLLTDYDRFTETFKRIHSLEVPNEDDHGARVRFNIKVLFLAFDYTLQRDYEHPLERLAWHRTAGDFRQITGSWEILPGPNDDTCCRLRILCRCWIPDTDSNGASTCSQRARKYNHAITRQTGSRLSSTYLRLRPGYLRFEMAPEILDPSGVQ